MKPPRIIVAVSLALAGYLLAWALAYLLTIMSRGDRPSLRECCEYLKLAWTFDAGELPGFIWLLSLFGFGALLLGMMLVARLRKR
jgi:hypothetical protein